MKNMWDQRYDTDEFVYGKEPNAFFAESLGLLAPGKILLPGEGEGRNAVFAASLGWDVDAFDQSSIAAEKASSFARERGMEIKYTACRLDDFPFKKVYYDAAGLIYFHAPPTLRQVLHQRVVEALKPGGMMIFEAFHISQLGNNTGGPQSLEMLYDKKILLKEFSSLEVDLIEELKVELNEGLFHAGPAQLVRYRGVKK